jgi:antitoxin component YwqK of YwqJK toxin-antitoxin module
MSGLWTYYYASGEVKEKVHYEHNFENGPFEEYYPDGTIKAKGNYLVGDNEDGLLFLYDESGDPERVMECDSGICRTQWTPDSTEIDFDEVY